MSIWNESSGLGEIPPGYYRERLRPARRSYCLACLAYKVEAPTVLFAVGP